MTSLAHTPIHCIYIKLGRAIGYQEFESIHHPIQTPWPYCRSIVGCVGVYVGCWGEGVCGCMGVCVEGCGSVWCECVSCVGVWECSG